MVERKLIHASLKQLPQIGQVYLCTLLLPHLNIFYFGSYCQLFTDFCPPLFSPLMQVMLQYYIERQCLLKCTRQILMYACKSCKAVHNLNIVAYLSFVRYKSRSVICVYMRLSQFRTVLGYQILCCFFPAQLTETQVS